VARLGTALMILGLLALGYGGLWQFGLAPGSRVVLPAPVALSPVQPPKPTLAPVQPPTPQLPIVQVPTPASPPDPRPDPAIPPVQRTLALPRLRLAAADALDRQQAAYPESAYAVRLAIPAIKLDTVVKQGGIVVDASGHPAWQTLPFVAVHYGDFTSLIGSHGNAVIAGHVVTLNEGNVFRFLYKVNADDQIQVWDDHEREHDYRVVDVKLVPPSDTSVMAPTRDQTLTLITCGGSFDPVRREFSDRLVVTAKPFSVSPPRAS
jgi:LPXTG-site transpeptidase (sortase) family protein